MPLSRVLTHHWGNPGITSLEGYLASGGWGAFKKALAMGPEKVLEEVKRSNLRGRGGAGFPTGTKWSFLPKGMQKPRYLCVNADESEPGTFKDRACIENDPHQIIEGIAITAFTIDCHTAYIYVRGEFSAQARILEKALREAYAAGLLGKRVAGSGFALDIHVHRGAGAYVCGEETALIESLEGKKGWPRLKPPFPAVVGLFGAPTIVNNIETVASVPVIVERGGDWYAKLGTEKSGGTKLVSVSGHVARPGVYEISLDTTFREIVFEICGGVPGGRKLKAIIPGGSSCPVLSAAEIEVAAEFEALKKVGSMAGSGGVIVMDDSTCMVRALWRISHFYAEESCGQCTPCREGTPWMTRILGRIEQGQGEPGDLDLLKNVANTIAPFPPMGLANTICPLGEAAALPVHSFLGKFMSEFEAHVREKRCPFPHPWGAAAEEFTV
jgi:NADH-quinone oxidoreductase subunit F